MPVGTYGAVKTLGSEDLEALGFEMVLSNTYHLSQRPGSELIEGQGGLVGVRHRDPVRSIRRFLGRFAAAWQSPSRPRGCEAAVRGILGWRQDLPAVLPVILTQG